MRTAPPGGEPICAVLQVLGFQIALRNNRRLLAAMRSLRLPAIKTLAQFDFTFQLTVKREQVESLHELGFLDRAETSPLLLHVCVLLNFIPVQPGFTGRKLDDHTLRMPHS